MKKLTYEEACALKGTADFEEFCSAIDGVGEPVTLDDCADVFASLRDAKLLVTPEERAVLESMAAATDFSIRENAELGGGWYKKVAKAELARRVANKEGSK